MTTVTNAGNVETRNWILTLVASATTIKVVNAQDATEPPLVLAGVVVGHTIVMNALTRTVTDNAVAAFTLIAPGSGWPAIKPGVNTVTVTGGTGTFRYYPLYV